jgi:hypothetical protein
MLNAADKYELRTDRARLPSRHAAADSEGPGFVRSRKHDPAADGDGLAAQRRVEQLLDRGIEGIEVRMEYGGCRFHPNRSPAKTRKTILVFEAARSRNIKRTRVDDCQAA